MLKSLPLYLFIMALAFPTAAFAQKKGPQGPTPVIAAPVKMQSFTDLVEALGTTKANETVVITPDTAEKVTAIHFEDGQFVKQGDLLIALDKSEEEAALNAAQASLSEAQSSYNRAKGLQNNSALSKGTLQERLAALKQAQAAIEEIKARIDKRDITAPFDGVLGLREVSVGTLVQPGDMITTIDDLSQIKVDFDVPAVFLSTLKPGMDIVGQIEAFGERKFKGAVRTINTQVDPVTRTVKVRAVIPNEDGVLKPGLLMSVTLMKNQRQALLIPEEALIKRGAENFVYVLTDSEGKTIAKEQKIEIGTRQPGVIEVLSGLDKGDKIVAHGTVKVRDGAAVTIRAVETEDAPLGELLKQKPVSGQSTK
ncbi:MAG: MexH family multidrug efflux RND transporter periplasmic adaptor subunit [Micavibrio sp.]|nr:MAG: MexH family multidrug efflux RND transporter periplasmic adaptor subunit [Micavibrio sp.]